MFRKMARTVALTVTTLLVISALVFAAEMKLTGEVLNIDDENNYLRMRTTEGKNQTFQATAGQMSSAEVGDQVEVVVENGAVKSLKKVVAPR